MSEFHRRLLHVRSNGRKSLGGWDMEKGIGQNARIHALSQKLTFHYLSPKYTQMEDYFAESKEALESKANQYAIITKTTFSGRRSCVHLDKVTRDASSACRGGMWRS